MLSIFTEATSGKSTDSIFAAATSYTIISPPYFLLAALILAEIFKQFYF